MITQRMGAREFRDLGFLQELNRCFLHPLGLALEVVVGEDGMMRFGDVQDHRDDPGGMDFQPQALDVAKARAIAELAESKRTLRQARYGGLIQPLPDQLPNPGEIRDTVFVTSVDDHESDEHLRPEQRRARLRVERPEVIELNAVVGAGDRGRYRVGNPVRITLQPMLGTDPC